MLENQLNTPPKLAYLIARRITQEIVNRGWVIGERLGTEAELLEKYKISREPFREALRLLEREGIIRTSRGRQGGIVVQAPALTAVSNITKSYFEFADISFWELSAALSLLTNYSIELAVAEMTPAHANDILQAIPHPRPRFRSRDQEGVAVAAIYDAIIRVADDACLAMLWHSLSRAIADFGHQERYPSAVWKEMIGKVWNHAEQMAIHTAKRNSKAAKKEALSLERWVKEVLTRLEQKYPKIWNTRSFLHGNVTSPTLVSKTKDKLAIILSYRVAADIRRSGLPPCTEIGTEAMLIKRFGASRALIRESLRMLEFFGVVSVRHGAAGGMMVAEPDPAMTIDSALTYLMFYQPPRDHLIALLNRIETEIARLVLEHGTHTALSTLTVTISRFTLQDRALDGELAMHSYRQLIDCGANRALNFIAKLLVSYLRHTSTQPASSLEKSEQLKQIKQAREALSSYLAKGRITGVELILRNLLAVLRTVACTSVSESR